MWPQRLQVWSASLTTEQLAVPRDGVLTVVEKAKGPLYVIPNGGGLGYGMFKLDADT